jgi:dipeptidyl aminopeptidase/acylaminoacyl peptidase
LEPNYRGGTGRGDSFLRSINGYASSRPTTDVLKGVDYLIAQGWADQNRMGVMGYSYGGILTNYIITQTNRFHVACSGAGVWNWISDFGTSIYGFFDEFWFDKTPWENFPNYWNESAISGAGKIQTPTLITDGEADRVCATSQSYELYRALVRQGVSTEFLVFPGEEHIFQKPSHKLTKVKAEIAWLDHYLLGTPLPDIK